jgi:hypothetical protein
MRKFVLKYLKFGLLKNSMDRLEAEEALMVVDSFPELA